MEGFCVGFNSELSPTHVVLIDQPDAVLTYTVNSEATLVKVASGRESR
jgi:hypothetical protein